MSDHGCHFSWMLTGWGLIERMQLLSTIVASEFLIKINRLAQKLLAVQCGSVEMITSLKLESYNNRKV